MVKFKYKECYFTITETTFQRMLRYKQLNNSFESGGMLIGSILTSGNEIEINDCTEPLEEDKQSRLSFRRSNMHNKLLKKKWEESEFTKLYLGEWHTHPQRIPSPSFLDKSTWKKLLYTSNTECRFLIFIIIGLNSMEIWIGDRKSKSLDRGGNYRY